MTKDPGVPLAHYRQHQADLLLMCGCPHSQVVPLETVISRRTARGFDAAQVGAREAVNLTPRPGAKCGTARWTRRPASPAIPGQNGFRV